jgi:cytoplasmic iron level regulating protein YaaA (DUF328/UPF0246 family)
MRIIISPAKKMAVNADSFACRDLPAFMPQAERLMRWMRGLSYDQQKALWNCSDAIARQNAERLAHMDLHRNLTPALLAYDGIQYASMAPTVFEDGQYEWVQQHLRILSAFYGVLRPFDGVVPYRLEMQAKAQVDGCRNLYGFWGDSLYREAMDETRVIVNLASKEYSMCIERYLQPEDTFVTCIFGEVEAGKVVQKGVYAKMARGEMVRYLAGIRATQPSQLRGFDWSGYALDEARSTDDAYVFTRQAPPGKASRHRI